MYQLSRLGHLMGWVCSCIESCFPVDVALILNWPIDALLVVHLIVIRTIASFFC